MIGARDPGSGHPPSRSTQTNRFFMLNFELIDEIPCANILGEGVQWNHQEQSVWWTDIKSNLIYRYHPATKRLEHWQTPEPVGCFAFAENDPRLLLALATGFAWFEKETGAIEWIARPEAHLTGNRLNDGRVDRLGRFWAGSIMETKHTPDQSASLFCLNTEQQVSQQLNGLTISNSLCWNLNSSKLYHADSPRQHIDIYDFDSQAGTLSNGRVFIHTKPGTDPDGSCIDSEDFLWNAQWGGSCVVRYSPDGVIDAVLNTPVSQPTCVAIGGAKMNLIFVTSARIGLTEAALDAQPQAGNLFIYRANVKGVQESWYKSSSAVA